VYRDGQILDLAVSDCEYAYKQSVFMHTDDVILGGTLRLTPSTPQTVKEEISGWLEKRAHLPKGKSMGCVFKNPTGFTAGALIDGAGLKGLRIGGAMVSTQHANFIINDNHATAREIHTLIGQMKERVFQRYGIALEEEIRYLQ
jgi:UDP-N-acetylmuramate dehydrogenase